MSELCTYHARAPTSRSIHPSQHAFPYRHMITLWSNEQHQCSVEWVSERVSVIRWFGGCFDFSQMFSGLFSLCVWIVLCMYGVWYDFCWHTHTALKNTYVYFSSAHTRFLSLSVYHMVCECADHKTHTTSPVDFWDEKHFLWNYMCMQHVLTCRERERERKSAFQ